MATGPLGFPRPFGIGPFTEEEQQDPQELLREIILSGHSYRNYSPEEFIILADSDIPLSEVRNEFRVIEAGRFNKMLKQLYKFWDPLDRDEKEVFAERNPGLMQWLETYATLEEIRKPSEDIQL